jgi:hypothetical protein
MLSRTGSALVALLAAGFPFAGCSAPIVDDAGDAHASTTQGLVLLERTEASDGTTQTNVSAKFMRMPVTVDMDLGERVVGTRIELPALGACVAAPPVEPAADVGLALDELGSIELLDVGDVTIRTGHNAMPLAVRAFPDVGDLVSGVFYTSRDAASDLPVPSRYVVESSGSAGIEAFRVEAMAPPSPGRVLLQERELDESPSLIEGEPVALRWSAFPRAERERLQHASDVVYVDLAAPERGALVRCTFRDAGQATIPGAALGADTFGAMPVTLTVGLHRVRRSALEARGPAAIDYGEMRFDVGVVGRVTLEPASAR